MSEAPAPVRSRPRSSRWRFVLVYGTAVGLGCLVGVIGVPPFRSSLPPSPSPARMALARARVGAVLRQPAVQAPPAAWAELQAEVAMVPQKWPPLVRNVFELVVATRGLTTGGRPDWSRAESLCHALRWSRCDRDALEQLRDRGRP